MVGCVIRNNRVFQQCVQSKPRWAAFFVRLVLFVQLVKTLEMYYYYYTPSKKQPILIHILGQGLRGNKANKASQKPIAIGGRIRIGFLMIENAVCTTIERYHFIASDLQIHNSGRSRSGIHGLHTGCRMHWSPEQTS